MPENKNELSTVDLGVETVVDKVDREPTARAGHADRQDQLSQPTSRRGKQSLNQTALTRQPHARRKRDSVYEFSPSQRNRTAPLPAQADDRVGDQRHDLAELVWKYFESEIREALIEVQAALANGNDVQTLRVTRRKQVGK